MKIEFIVPTRIATWIIQKKFDQENECENIEIEDRINGVINYLKEIEEENETLYRFLMGTLFIHYLELGILQPEDVDIELFELLMNEDFETINMSLYEYDNEFYEDEVSNNLFEELIFTTIDINEYGNDEWNEIRNNVIELGYGNIYSRFNPYFEIEEMMYRVSYPKEEDLSLERDFCNEYKALKEVLSYPEHIIYVLTDVLKNKYSLETSNIVMEKILQKYYFFIKGRSIYDVDFILEKDHLLINKIETSTYLNTVIDDVRENQELLSHVVERYFYYQDHRLDEDQLSIEKKSDKEQYMKKFPKKKDQLD